MVMRMSEKEIAEARRARIPEQIISKMAQGIEPSEREKEIIKKLGKVYVEAHKKNGKWVKPQLRDFSKVSYEGYDPRRVRSFSDWDVLFEGVDDAFQEGKTFEQMKEELSESFWDEEIIKMYNRLADTYGKEEMFNV